MKIVANTTDIPSQKVTTKPFSYAGSTSTSPEPKVTFGAEQTVQNTPAARITVTNSNYAAMRKMHGDDKHLYAVGSVTAQPDKIGDRHLDDFTREPKQPFIIPDQRDPIKK